MKTSSAHDLQLDRHQVTQVLKCGNSTIYCTAALTKAVSDHIASPAWPSQQLCEVRTGYFLHLGGENLLSWWLTKIQ